MRRLSGELAVDCSTLVDLPRQTHGLRWMRDELMAPPDRRLTLNVCWYVKWMMIACQAVLALRQFSVACVCYEWCIKVWCIAGVMYCWSDVSLERCIAGVMYRWSDVSLEWCCVVVWTHQSALHSRHLYVAQVDADNDDCLPVVTATVTVSTPAEWHLVHLLLYLYLMHWQLLCVTMRCLCCAVL